MAVFDKTCGKFRLTVSEPWPMWIKITDAEGSGYDGDFPRHADARDLHDLKHLVERAIAAAVRKDSEAA